MCIHSLNVCACAVRNDQSISLNESITVGWERFFAQRWVGGLSKYRASKSQGIMMLTVCVQPTLFSDMAHWNMRLLAPCKIQIDNLVVPEMRQTSP